MSKTSETSETSACYTRYEHHGKQMWVSRFCKGRHRIHCLCFDCKKFKPKNRDANCQKANALYELCVKHDLVTPVWECADFEEIRK